MSICDSDLCPEARKLIELMGGPGCCTRKRESGAPELSKVLTDHPELIVGLDEYTRWRDQVMINTGQEDENHPVEHDLRDILKDVDPRR